MRITYVNAEGLSKLRLSKGQWALLWTLVDYINVETGEARVYTSELADRLGRSSGNVSAELRRLTDLGIIRRTFVGVWAVEPTLITRDPAAVLEGASS